MHWSAAAARLHTSPRCPASVTSVNAHWCCRETPALSIIDGLEGLRAAFDWRATISTRTDSHMHTHRTTTTPWHISELTRLPAKKPKVSRFLINRRAAQEVIWQTQTHKHWPTRTYGNSCLKSHCTKTIRIYTLFHLCLFNLDQPANFLIFYMQSFMLTMYWFSTACPFDKSEGRSLIFWPTL